MATKKQSSPIVTLAIYGIIGIGLFYVHDGMLMLSHRVSSLPVEGLVAEADESAVTKEPATKTLHPFLVEASKRTQALQYADADTFDTLFGKKDADLERMKQRAIQAAQKRIAEPVAEPVNPLQNVDFFQAVIPVLQLQAISGDGAIVNGKYVVPGEPIANIPYPNAKAGVINYPVLLSVGSNSVVVKEQAGPRTIEIKLTSQDVRTETALAAQAAIDQAIAKAYAAAKKAEEEARKKAEEEVKALEDGTI